MRVKPGKKKTWIVMLCLALALTTLPGAAFAVNTYTASDQCVEKIKAFEDYRQMPYADSSGRWYIGYGSACDPADYPNGVSEAEAEILLREDLAEAEAPVNQLLTSYGISVTQYQFDALASITYNLGLQWINPDYRLCSYLINGIDRYTEAEVVNAIATWCHTSGNTVMENLVSRRLWEAFLFLYGDYDNDGASRYCYIDYEVNGGVRDPAQDSRTIFYPVGLPYGQLPQPSKEGQSFQGWYTAEGIQLTGEETAAASQHVYARWGGAEVTPIVTAPQVDYSAWINPYLDVKEEDWFYPYVRELSYHSILGGYPDGSFRGNNKLTAGEALKLILLAAGLPDPGNAFSGHWAGNYQALAEGLGLLTPGQILDLDGQIDRGTVAQVTALAMGMTMELELQSGTSPFADADNSYTYTLYHAGVITGETTGGHRYYYPADGISRAEVSAIVSRIRNYQPANNPALSGYIEYGGKRIPVLWDVPAAPYNKDMLVKEGSIMHYYDPAYSTAIGIDVSRHQGDIDWQKVAASGMVDFAFVRLGGRGWGSEGKTYVDENFEKNLTGAQFAGIPAGVYFYSTATTVAEALEEAQLVVQTLGGRYLEYPVIFDWEIDNKEARNANVDKTVATDSAIAFCETVAQAGYTPMVYIGLNTAYNKLELNRLTMYDFWFAQYKSQPDMYYNYRIWQYSDSGSVPGIEGKVDMDIAFIPY